MPSNGDKSATKADVTFLKADIGRLDQKIDRVATELVQTKSEVREIKNDLATKIATKDDVDRIMNAIDAFAKKGEIYDRAAVLHGHALVEVQSSLKDHEKRLKTLESARP